MDPGDFKFQKLPLEGIPDFKKPFHVLVLGAEVSQTKKYQKILINFTARIWVVARLYHQTRNGKGLFLPRRPFIKGDG